MISETTIKRAQTVQQSAPDLPTTHHSLPQYTWIEIDKKAFAQNVNVFKALVGPTVHIAVVVKGNAYGHGMLEVAALCQEHDNVSWLCTSHLYEAVMLRNAGITKPILVMSILDLDPRLAILNDITVTVYNIATIQMLNACAKELNKKASVHIKIDTGLSRFGILFSDAHNHILEIARYSHITITGIFSHFSESESESSSFTQEQIQRFGMVLEQFQSHGIDIPLRHMNNTAATALGLGTCNLVRLGAGIYGLQPSDFVLESARAMHQHFSLKPVMTWKTKIAQIRAIPAHSFVGYNRTHRTEQPALIAILPIGYYDGYDRRLSNKGMVHVRSKTAPILGRICMNVTIIDVTHIPNVAVDDEVVLLGAHEHTTAFEIARNIESHNPREITTRLNPLIKRVVIE